MASQIRKQSYSSSSVSYSLEHALPMGIFPKFTYCALHGDQASASLPHPWSRQEMSSPPPPVTALISPLKQLLEALIEFLKDVCTNSLSLMFCPKGLHHCFLVCPHILKGYSFPSSPVSALFLQNFSSNLLHFPSPSSHPMS